MTKKDENTRKAITDLEFKHSIVKIITNIAETNQKVTVTTPKRNLVILSQLDYDSLKETIRILSNSNLVNKVKQGEKEDVETIFIYSPDKAW